MKKVMFLIVGMLFSLSANAATINIVNDIVDPGVTLVGIVPNNSDPSVASFSNDGGDFLIGTAVTSDTTGNYKVEWTFNPANAFLGGDITLGENSVIYGFSQAITGSYSFIASLVAGTAQFFDIKGSSNGSMGFQLSVSSVPVPAALFLFAPALLGFFGLRRKAAVAA